MNIHISDANFNSLIFTRIEWPRYTLQLDEGEKINMLKQHFQNSIFNFASKMPLMRWSRLYKHQTQNMNHLLCAKKKKNWQLKIEFSTNEYTISILNFCTN